MKSKIGFEALQEAKGSWEGIRRWLEAKPDDIVIFTADVRCYRGSMALAIGDSKAIFINRAGQGAVYDMDKVETISKGAFVVIHPWQLAKPYSFKVPFPWACFEKDETEESLRAIEAKQSKDYDATRSANIRTVFKGPEHWKESQLMWRYGGLYD